MFPPKLCLFREPKGVIATYVGSVQMVLGFVEAFRRRTRRRYWRKEASGSGGEGRDWTSSALLFLMLGGLMYYLFNFAPDLTPKLLNSRGDDGFRMNGVLVPLWYIMSLWPLVYTMLLLPSGRSTKGSIPVWPFLVLSCGADVYDLLPYFVLWRPLHLLLKKLNSKDGL